MTSTAEVAAGAKSVAVARPLGVQRTGLGQPRQQSLQQARRSVVVGETSRQKSVDVEQLMQRAEEQFLEMGQERQERTLRFFEKKLRKRCERLGQVEKERSPSYWFFRQACGRIS